MNLPTVRRALPSTANPNAPGVGLGDIYVDPAGAELPAIVQGPVGAQVLVALGGAGWEYVVVDTPISVAVVKGSVVFADATGGAVVLSLPVVAGSTRPIIVSKRDASVNTVTIDAAGAETINGAPTFVLTAQFESVTLFPNAGASTWGIF